LKAFLPEKDKIVNELFEFNQPLGNFSNKINLCYSLGLIDKIVKDDLNMIRKIRNNFAHELNISFNDENIKSLSNEIKWHKLFYAIPPEESTSRDLFQVGVLQLISHLGGVISIARGEKRKIKK
jgi:DNA-binding MltR family transcriptional regulator